METSQNERRSSHSTTFRLREDVVPVHTDIHWFLDDGGADRLRGEIGLQLEYTVLNKSSVESPQQERFALHALNLQLNPEKPIQLSLVTPGQTPDDASEDESAEPLGESRGSSGPQSPKIKVTPHTRTPITTCELVEDPANECWIINFSLPLEGSYAGGPNSEFAKGEKIMLLLEVSYSTAISEPGVISNAEKRSGVFRWSRTEQNAVVTHLEPTHCRKLMPCFDEPCFRCTFELTLSVPVDIDAISGTVEREELSRDEKYRTIRFEQTIALPSYLISFATGKFNSVKEETKRGIVCRIVFPAERESNEALFALDLVCKAVQFYEDYFQYALPMKKLDVVAVDEFPVLGMENWGMVVILRAYLLVTPTTSIERRRRIARLIGHEVVHQWFGNIVSLNWWRYIWLKEGMARYMEFVFVHHCRPKWQIWTDFLSQVQNVALIQDANCSPDKAHPIETEPLADPRKVFDLFDVISYGKAASVIRMMAGAMGEDNFVAALRDFFQKYALQSVSSAELYECLSARIKPPPEVPLATRFNEWVTVVGHPYLLVEKRSDGVRVTQFRMPSSSACFLSKSNRSMGGSRVGASNTSSVGTPGLNIASGESTMAMTPRIASMQIVTEEIAKKTKLWIPLRCTEIEQGQTTASKQFELKDESTVYPCSSFVWFHTSGIGTFRVDYDVASWEHILEVYPFFSVLDRLTICISIFELRLLHVGILPNDEKDRCLLLLKLFDAISDKKESHNLIWASIAPLLQNVLNIVRGTSVWAVLQLFFLKSLQHLTDKNSISFFASNVVTGEFDINNNSEMSDATLAELLRTLCLCKSPEFVDEAQEYWTWLMSSLSPDFVPPPNRETPPDDDSISPTRANIAMECVGMYGTRAQWNAMYDCFVYFWEKKRRPKEGMGTSPSNPEAMRFHAHANISNVMITALLAGLLAREDADVTTIQLKIVGQFTGLGSAENVMACNNKLLSTVVDAAATGNDVVASELLVSILNHAKKFCSNPAIAQTVANISSLKGQAAEISHAMLQNCHWVDYITDHYLSHLQRFHQRTSSGLSVSSRGSLGT